MSAYPCQIVLGSDVSSHPTLCLIRRAGSHMPCYILPLIFSYLTSSTSARKPSHTFSWFTYVFSFWKHSLHYRHLNLRSWCKSACILFCGCPGHPCSCRFFHIHHTGMPISCISLFLATILSSSSVRFPLLLSHSLRCPMRSPIMSLHLSVLPHCSRFQPPLSCLSLDSAPAKLDFLFTF